MSNNTENSGTAFPLALTRAQARFALAAGRALDKLVGEIPPARAATGEAPERQARDIAARAARRAAAISGGLSLPGGLLGIAAILPSLVKVWRIQAQMVADIAAAHGVHAELRREHLLYCLFKHSAGHAVADLAVRAGGRYVTDALARRSSEQALRAIGLGLSQQALSIAALYALPLAGAAAMALYARRDTLQVADAALQLMRQLRPAAAHSTAQRAP